MALDVYVKEDILRVLHALHMSSGAASVEQLRALSGLPQHEIAPDQALVQCYQRGYTTALASVALAFGLASVVPVQTGETHDD